MRNYFWLLSGALAAVAIPWWGLGAGAAAGLHGVLPLPWASLGAGVTIFGTASALHFRQQLMETLSQMQRQQERYGAASRLIGVAADDGSRWLRVVQENLDLVGGDVASGSHAHLYLEGARAHADKLEQAFERIEGSRRRLDTPAD